MTVQHAEAPGRHHQEARPWKQHTHNLDRQLTLGAAESRCDDGDEERRRKDAPENQDRHDEREH